MELRTVDPRDLKPNPDNPRRVAAGEHADQQLVANIKAIGITQPPIVRCEGDTLMIIAGERRVRAAIAAGLPEIVVLVREANDGSDSVRSLSENVVRAQMGAVDQWRAIEALASDNWTEEAIGAALALPIRTIKKLRLLAHIHPAILDHIARGDMPQENNLRTIAAASADEQASVWKKHKPKKGQPTVHWWELARALEKRRLYAKEAKFGAYEEQAFGIVWQEDLFEQGDEDTRYTTQVDAFFAAQTAWLDANLPENGVILQIDDYGRAKLPPKAEQVWGQRKKSDMIGTYINPRDGSIEKLVYRLPERAAKKGKNGPASVDAETGSEVAKVRPEITQKGLAMIGDFRSDALAKALAENKIDDFTLLGLMIVAFGAENISVTSSDYSSERRQILQRLTEDGRLTLDPELIRKAAREMLTHVLSCRPGFHSSGIAALFVGDAIGADAHLPNMATEEFLSCLSKPGVEKAAAATSVLPRPRTKDTRAALIEHVGEGTLILPAARFAPTEEELSAHLKPIISYHFEGNEDDSGNDPIESASDGDDGESIESESFVDESLVEEC